MSLAASAAAALLVDVVRDLVRQAWGKIAGGVPVAADQIDAIERVVERAIAGTFASLERDLRVQIDELASRLAAQGLTIGLAELEARARDVLEAFRPPGTFPQLGLDIEIVDEIRHPEGSSER